MADKPGRVRIIGDGPAAWATAIGLALRDWEVTIHGERSATRGTRIELLAADCMRQLVQLGVSSQTLAAVAHPCPGTWSRWEAGPPAEVDQTSSLWGTGWSIHKGQLDAMLRDRAQRLGVQSGPSRPSGGARQGRVWQVLATGAARRHSARAAPDDELIAITACGNLHPDCAVTDARLLIEALPDGWAYGLMGPARSAGIAFITDALCLKGQDWQRVALASLRGTERISRVLDGLVTPFRFSAVPVPCQWLQVRAGPHVVRVGDAQASHDPIAGRGLWHALWSANQISACLDQGASLLSNMEDATRRGYGDYLVRRQYLYARALERFSSPFWARRARVLGILVGDLSVPVREFD